MKSFSVSDELNLQPLPTPRTEAGEGLKVRTFCSGPGLHVSPKLCWGSQPLSWLLGKRASSLFPLPVTPERTLWRSVSPTP